MNKLISSVLVASVLGLAATSAFACPDGKKGHKFERLSEELELTEAQETKVKEIMEVKRENMKSYHAEQRAEVLSQLGTVLTEEQLAEFEEISERRMKHHRKER